MLKKINLILILLIFTTFTACNNSNNGFDSVINSSQNPNQNNQETPVSITAYTPASNPVVITSSNTVTFSVNPGNGTNVKYEYTLNGTKLSETSPFLNIAGSSLTAGNHTLIAKVYNSISQASHTFNIRKNTAPQINSHTPASPTGNTLDYTSTLLFNVTASDVDSDTLTYTWKFDGQSSSPLLSVSAIPSGTQALFSPTIAQVGTHSVSVEVSDGYESTSYTWQVEVQNNNNATIIAHTPTTNPVIIPSGQSQLFSISATGKPPVSYSWYLNGVLIPGANTTNYTVNNNGSLAYQDHILTAKVEDYNSSDTYSFTVRINSPPQITSYSPNQPKWKMNFGSQWNFSTSQFETSQATFQVFATDANSTDTLNYTWTLNGNASSTISSNNIPVGSQAIFTPTALQVGSNTISVTVSDGTQSVTQSWTVEVNYFSTACNQIMNEAPSTNAKICTLVGQTGIGSGLNPLDDITKIKITPRIAIDDGNGNIFFSDNSSPSIWFYNRSSADITILGKTIKAGTVQAVVGRGGGGKNPDGNQNLRFKISSAQGLAWDQPNQRLFIADYSNHRVVMIDNTGTGTTVFGTGFTIQNTLTNADGTSGISHVCGNPTALLLHSNNLYIACTGTHAIKRLDLSNMNGYMVVGKLTAGSTSAASTDGTPGAAGTAQTNTPAALSKDSSGNIYFTENAANNCRLRVYNTQGSALSLMNGGLSIPANSVGSIAGPAATACSTTSGAYNAMKFNASSGAGGLSVLVNGGSILGFFISSYLNHAIMFLNNTNSPITVGGVSVPAISASVIWNQTLTASYNGESNLGKNSFLWNPYFISLNSNSTELWVSDYSNFRIRALDLTIGNGRTSLLLGSGRAKYGFETDVAQGAQDVSLNAPTQLAFESGYIYYSDSRNGRIRRVNLVTGLVDTLIGKGLGNPTINNEDPTNVFMRGPRQILIHNGNILYVDNEWAAGANRSCMVRAFNRSSSSSNIFGINIMSNKVSTILGDYVTGCVAWNPAWAGTSGTSIGLQYPEGIAVDSSGNLYLTNYNQHCILKLTPSGTVSSYLGLCGTMTGAPPTDGSITNTAARLRYPIAIKQDPLYPDNFFVIDATDQANAYLRYINNTASAISFDGGGITAPANQITTLLNTSLVQRGIDVALFSNQICISGGYENSKSNGSSPDTNISPHNIICYDRNNFGSTKRIGPIDSSLDRGGGPLGNEQEAINSNNPSVAMSVPYGIVFDNEGNLYIADKFNHVIRFVRRWF